MLKPLSLALLSLTLFACPPQTKCEPATNDAGMETLDAGGPTDAGAPTYEVHFQFVNLSRDTVLLRFEGEDAGEPVLPLESLLKTGHVTLIKQRGVVEGRALFEDGGTQQLSAAFEFDTTSEQPVTFVASDLTLGLETRSLTVAKQTQGVDFGQRVQAGLQQAGSVIASGTVDVTGDCRADNEGGNGAAAGIGLYDEPPTLECPAMELVFVRPAQVARDATPYFVAGLDGEVNVAWVAKVVEKATSGLKDTLKTQVRMMSPTTAPIRELYVLNAHQARLPATVSIEGVTLATDVAPGALVRVPSKVVASAARKGISEKGLPNRGVVVSMTVGATTSTVTVGSVLTGPCRPPYLCDFMNDEDVLLVVSENPGSSATVLRSKHDTAKNSVGNIRRTIAPGTTSNAETRGCVAVFAGDDTCVMGAANFSGGGASSAAYAATGRMLYPPKAAPANGAPLLFAIDESTTRFFWNNPLGLTPRTGKVMQGSLSSRRARWLTPRRPTNVRCCSSTRATRRGRLRLRCRGNRVALSASSRASSQTATCRHSARRASRQAWRPASSQAVAESARAEVEREAAGLRAWASPCGPTSRESTRVDRTRRQSLRRWLGLRGVEAVPSAPSACPPSPRGAAPPSSPSPPSRRGSAALLSSARTRPPAPTPSTRECAARRPE